MARDQIEESLRTKMASIKARMTQLQDAQKGAEVTSEATERELELEAQLVEARSIIQEQIIDDINITVQSGEFDTEGLLAKAKFHVSYRGKPLIKALQQVLANSLRYFLRRPTTEEGSY
ncbi:hypothetical protein OsI_28382 [Oryza sativa Indica Group]|uniref:Uncharacterized protein n=1 Tax=Oryza sativa subsp. indica TaxID=39946 RepID=A2YST7_ORYSI|nr:hypothetical protein OsI_28382 [Oryza sativa Indica Group]